MLLYWTEQSHYIHGQFQGKRREIIKPTKIDKTKFTKYTLQHSDLCIRTSIIIKYSAAFILIVFIFLLLKTPISQFLVRNIGSQSAKHSSFPSERTWSHSDDLESGNSIRNNCKIIIFFHHSSEIWTMWCNVAVRCSNDIDFGQRTPVLLLQLPSMYELCTSFIITIIICSLRTLNLLLIEYFLRLNITQNYPQNSWKNNIIALEF